MAHEVNINGVKFYTELRWRVLTALGAERKNQIKALVEEIQPEGVEYQYGVILDDAGKDTSGAIGVLDLEKNKFKKGLSLAATLAQRSVSGLYLYELEEPGQFWYTYIDNGSVMPGSDVWINEEALGAKLSELADLRDDLQVYTDVDFEELPGIVKEDIHFTSIHTILSDLKPTPIKSIGGGTANFKKAFVFTTFLLAAAFALYQVAPKPKPAPPKFNQVAKQPVVKKVGATEIVQQINQQLNINGLFTFSNWHVEAVKLMRKTSFLSTGWVYEKSVCSATKGCVFTWVATEESSSKYIRHILKGLRGQLITNPSSNVLEFHVLGRDLWLNEIRETAFTVEKYNKIPEAGTAQAALADFCQTLSASNEVSRCAFKVPKDIQKTGVKPLTFWELVVNSADIDGINVLLNLIKKNQLYVNEITYMPENGKRQVMWKVEINYVAK